MELHTFLARHPVNIRFAEPGKLARKVVKRSNARLTSKYPSWKMRSMLQCESDHERNCMLLLDICPWVKSFRPQPCVINYSLDGDEHKHFPDIFAETYSGNVLIEVKTRACAHHPDVIRRTAYLSEVLPAYGFHYRLMLAEDLAMQPRLDNAEVIKRLGKTEVPALQREHVRTLFQQSPSISWGDLHQDRHSPDLTRHVCRMALEGYLSIDLNQPLTDNTLVRWVNNSTESGGASWESLISKKAL